MLEDYDNTICVSAETPRELIIQYNNNKLVAKLWKSARDMVDSINRDYFINILPLREEHMKTYSEMELNVAQDHRGPSDHMTCLIFSFLALESAKLPTFPDTAK